MPEVIFFIGGRIRVLSRCLQYRQAPELGDLFPGVELIFVSATSGHHHGWAECFGFQDSLVPYPPFAENHCSTIDLIGEPASHLLPYQWACAPT